MKKPFIPVLLSLAIALSACSSTPTTTSTLEQARNDFTAAQNSTTVSQYAPRELKAATEALDAANAAAADRQPLEKIDQLAYLAKQKIATAQEVARAKQAEVDLKSAAQQRDQVRLEARTAEAEQAKRSAEQAQAEAEAARARAERAHAATQNAQAQAQALAAQLAELQAKQTERGTIITLGDVLFNTDQAVLTSQGQASVQKLATVLTQNPDRTVLIEGFTDSTGSTAHNLELSQRRAEAVRSALSQMGIARDRVETRGYGEAYPVAGNESAGDRQLNRRVEIVLSEPGKPIQARR
ncbi:outer membrane protein OmpA-like peptidoglycan-associated protein [Pseudoduganella lurida]|uniref:Outer membrane protein OmpA-like peptidoglycan-associated protein n=1 Tax=Pseudoduganella lurida TaxID=1036180 RepID=A0A562RM65_9BURK|nr:OmpA family protein [Pseudoduganella lurida]TWI70148.1 outer membrane protein OmpA-like peptidoglycan-associated protein [Pseudoduganella lurida]